MARVTYKLVNKRPVPCDIKEWGSRDRVVKQTQVGTAFVSTVFLGIDHSFSDEGPPILFETMIFDGPNADARDDQWRYATWDEAVANHDRVCAQLAKTTEKRS